MLKAMMTIAILLAGTAPLLAAPIATGNERSSGTIATRIVEARADATPRLCPVSEAGGLIDTSREREEMNALIAALDDARREIRDAAAVIGPRH